MRLKSLRSFPPGQWAFRQPETGWSVQLGLVFEDAVRAIIKHRLANPRWNLATSYDVVANELEQYTCARINNDSNYCTENGLSSSFPVAPLPQRVVGRAVAAVGKYAQNTAAGIGLYAEWFGSGMPVTQELADARAEICLSGCPKHEKGNLGERFNEMAAKQIMQVFEILHDLKLHTKREAELHVCSPCSCPMKAKVWSPLDIILKHLRPEAKAELWEKCWMLNEK